MQNLIRPTTAMRSETKSRRTLFTVLALLVAVAMFAAALGSGNPTTAEPLPTWIDMGANLVAALIGILVLLPRTRGVGSIAALVLMVLSMGVNYIVDGYAFFLRALPFNLGTIVIAFILARHYWEDLPDTFKPAVEKRNPR